MIKTNTKTVSFFILPALFAILIAGCDKEAQPAEETPDSESIDLAQVPDLFEQPLQPNPLARAPEDVVVTVNGETITHGEIMQSTQQRMMQMSRQVPPQQLSELYPRIYQEISEMMVANILLGQAAEKSSLAVSDEALAEAVTQFESNIPEGQTLAELLAENKMEMDELKGNMRKQLLVGKLVEEKTSDVEEATAAEAATFYTENTDSFKVPESVAASHILIKSTPEDTDETKAKKKEDLAVIHEQILAGGSFEELASEHSDCPSSEQGGSLGTFGRGQMVPEFEEAAFGMTAGDISDIVETKFGFHLIKVTEYQKESVRSLAEVKDQIQAYLTAQKKQEALMAYIGELKKSAEVVAHRPDFDAAAGE